MHSWRHPMGSFGSSFDTRFPDFWPPEVASSKLPAVRGKRLLRKLRRKLVRPGDFGIGAHKPEAADARLHKTIVLVQDRGIALKLDAEYHLLPLLDGLHALWRELRICRHVADRRGNNVLGDRIGDDARFVAQQKFASHIPRQVDRQVDVLKIEDAQNALVCCDQLTGAGKPELHA